MSNEYTRHAHKRTIWAELQRVLLQRFVSTGDGPAKEALICEEVFFADKDVSEETVLEVMEELQRKEADERIQMTQYEFRRRDVHKGATKAVAEDGEEVEGVSEAGAKGRSKKSAGGAAPPGT